MTNSLQFTQSIHEWMDVFMHRSMRGWGLFAKSIGLSMPQFSILMQLHHKGAFGMSEILFTSWSKMDLSRVRKIRMTVAPSC